MFDSCYSINILLLLGVAWCVVWWIYNYFIRTPSFNPMGKVLIPLPSWIQNIAPHVSLNPKKNDPKLLNIDGWSIGHIMVYISIGLFFPGKYIAILIISILCEAYEYAVGWRARWLVDPAVNIVGYILGCIIEKQYKYNFYKRMKTVLMFHHIGCSFSLIAVLILILFVNQPHFMKNDFY
jgi:hypothetical protein